MQPQGPALENLRPALREGGGGTGRGMGEGVGPGLVTTLAHHSSYTCHHRMGPLPMCPPVMLPLLLLLLGFGLLPSAGE